MAKKQRKYDMEYKIQAVKQAKELGGAKAAAGIALRSAAGAGELRGRMAERPVRRACPQNTGDLN